MGTSLSVKGSGKARVSKVSKTFYFLRTRKNCRKTYFVLVLTVTEARLCDIPYWRKKIKKLDTLSWNIGSTALSMAQHLGLVCENEEVLQ